ncbi:MAG: LacI family DNA-binding transcriptional regulator [Pseudomonadota bacterium]
MANEGPDQGSITADDVAALAGVSRWTVNRAFKKGASISEKSRAKVAAAAKQLGYVPDLLASSLASDRSNLIALLIDDFANPHKLVMMEGLTRALRQAGWDTLLVNTISQADTSAAILQASRRRVDAAVLIGSGFTDQAIATARDAYRVRKLIVFARYSPDPFTISICCDDVSALVAITNHVADRGYRRPLFVAGPQTPSAHLKRQETFLGQWQKICATKARMTVANTYDPRKAYEHIKGWFADAGKGPRPDVLVCENDSIAMAALDVVRHELGLRVPQDIAVIGFDDVPQAANPNYRLSTYSQPIRAMASALVSVLEGHAPTADLTKFQGQLMIRDST